jgi:hypothetical protein
VEVTHVTRHALYRGVMNRLRWMTALMLTAATALAGCGGGEEESAESEAAAGVGAASGLAESGEAGDPLAAVLRVLELSEDFRAVLVDEALIANPADLEVIGRHYCEGLDVCRTSIWFDEEYFPETIPVPEQLTRFTMYGFGRNVVINYEASQWNCAFFPQFEASRRCLPRPF